MNLLFRVIFACLFGLLGFFVGREISLAVLRPETATRLEYDAIPLLGMLVGIGASPFIARGFER